MNNDLALLILIVVTNFFVIKNTSRIIDLEKGEKELTDGED